MGSAIFKTKIGTGFIRGPGITPCHECAEPSDYLCDYPIGDGKTCDLPLCQKCANVVGEKLDFCQIHFAQFKGEHKVGMKSNVKHIQ